MTDVQADMDDVYQRAERKYSSIERQIQWLSSFSDGGSYANGAIQVATELAAAQGIRQKATSLKSVESLEDLRSEAEDISINKVKNETVKIVNDRIVKAKKIEQEAKMAREGATEKKLRGNIRSASTESEFAAILREAEGEVSDSAYNRLSDEVDRRVKDIRQEKAEQKELEDQRKKQERILQDKINKETQQKIEDQINAERKAEANRIRIEAEARKEAQREIQREERRIAEQVAREQLRQNV